MQRSLFSTMMTAILLGALLAGVATADDPSTEQAVFFVR